MKLFRNILLLATIIIVFASGFYIASDIFGGEKVEFSPSESRFIDDSMTKKIRLSDAILEKFEAKKELITSEVELSETVQWDASWGELDIFHKSQMLRFYGIGIYITDLNLITPSDIVADEERRTVSVAIPHPVIKSVTIDEDKTEYEDVKNGWLRFGQIKITPEQYNILYGATKEKMEAFMNDPSLYKEAEENTLNAVTEIFQSILDAIGDGYKLTITWKD